MSRNTSINFPPVTPHEPEGVFTEKSYTIELDGKKYEAVISISRADVRNAELWKSYQSGGVFRLTPKPAGTEEAVNKTKFWKLQPGSSAVTQVQDEILKEQLREVFLYELQKEGGEWQGGFSVKDSSGSETQPPSLPKQKKEWKPPRPS